MSLRCGTPYIRLLPPASRVATIAVTDTNGYGAISNYGSAGLYELIPVQSWSFIG